MEPMEPKEPPAATPTQIRSTVTLALAMLLASLGTSIANIALPALSEAFAAPFVHEDVALLMAGTFMQQFELTAAHREHGDEEAAQDVADQRHAGAPRLRRPRLSRWITDPT